MNGDDAAFQQLNYLFANMQNPDQNVQLQVSEQLTQFKSHLEYLPIFLNYLNQIANSDMQLFGIFLVIKELLTNRGCLLNVQQLQQQVEILMNAVTRFASTIAKTTPTTNICSDAVGLSYRLLAELMMPEIQPFQPLFRLFESSDPLICHLSLNIMISVVRNIKKPLRHYTDIQQRSLQTNFQQTQLALYFQAATNAISGPLSQTLSAAALSLMLECLNFTPNKDIDKFYFVIPANMICFYQNTSIPEAMFRIYHQNLNTNEYLLKSAIEILLYFSSANETSWNQIANSRITFYQYIARNLTDILNQTIQLEVLLPISRLVFKFSTIVPLNMFLQDQNISVPFFMSVKNISNQAFQSIADPRVKEASMYFLRFWSRLATYCRSNTLPPEFIQLFPDVFDSYVTSILNSITNDITYDTFISRFNNFSTFIDENKALWSIAIVCPQHSAEYISGIIATFTQQITTDPQNPESQITILRLIILLLIITSRFVTYTLSGELIPQLVILLNCIFGFINNTNQVFEQLVQTYPMFSFVEQSLCYFASNFKRDYLLPKSNHIYENEVYKQLDGVNNPHIAFDILVNRFLHDLKIFTNSPALLENILRFIQDLAYKQDNSNIKTYIANNELLQALINRQIILDFKSSTTNIKNMHTLIPFLNTIYARSIRNNEQWLQFLRHFDQQFVNLAASNYESDIDVYYLYREIDGVLKGTIIHP
ncbi:hypothetical protein GPJ56_005679 [Histomonas meleagridis]|uniref:uncharacterized protein n=1 Tax=Histomonas meleagridis TaxID=135588 RepID=UPI00355AB925|nr:hypothetical protein GPJ56_005679 [Histomonas meleagridis]KAH0803386.1 hypothetical protein GO595_003730 [Histomonas meleagridis]